MIVARPYLQEVIALTGRPEPQPKEVLGYHGAPFSALGRTAVTGHLPATGAFGKEFYFAPITVGRQDGWVEPAQARREATVWAGLNARVRYMLDAIGAESVKPKKAVERARALWDAMIDTYFMDLELTQDNPPESMSDVSYGHDIVEVVGLPEDQVLRLYRESLACRGVLLTLSMGALDEFKLTGGDGQGAADNALMTRRGLPLRHVSHIELLGDYEHTQLEALKAT